MVKYAEVGREIYLQFERVSARGVQPDRDRPVVDERNRHVGAEFSSFDGHPKRRQSACKMFIERPALIG